ncbi:NAD-dependent epimerase/dehydratase family protein [Marisediminicola senii]|uniref:NAD-dependent epimerase/dehydratase family protein n=1 Tax=Marisediminicola senii TaxID=2711233 RepID=UPI0013ED8276|nr:NAD-dependent epimerase/dehydratase family protein [Marisediminicola senii]
MRVVIVGASGNLGTAILGRLGSVEPRIDLVGVSRRAPDLTTSPYAGASWRQVDIGAPGSVASLTAAFRGADAVVHLAWALQPNRDERAMFRTNVTGTAHVLAAVAAAGVPQVVVASSVGAYSAGPKNRRVDESWPTGGLHTSHYSRHKALNERALDAFEAQHPSVVLTRMRPGLVFQRGAAKEIAGLFLGRFVPTSILRAVRPPVLPLPLRMITQAVHASDLADAVWRAIDRKAAGAFNIAAEPVLTPARIARAIGARRHIPVSAAAMRWLAGVTWKLRLQQTDPGWIDIAVATPLMSTERARTELGWIPAIRSTDAMAELIDGMADVASTPGSPQLR